MKISILKKLEKLLTLKKLNLIFIRLLFVINIFWNRFFSILIKLLIDIDKTLKAILYEIKADLYCFLLNPYYLRLVIVLFFICNITIAHSDTGDSDGYGDTDDSDDPKKILYDIGLFPIRVLHEVMVFTVNQIDNLISYSLPDQTSSSSSESSESSENASSSGSGSENVSYGFKLLPIVEIILKKIANNESVTKQFFLENPQCFSLIEKDVSRENTLKNVTEQLEAIYINSPIQNRQAVMDVLVEYVTTNIAYNLSLEGDKTLDFVYKTLEEGGVIKAKYIVWAHTNLPGTV